MSSLSVGMRTDVGRVRKNNQDCLTVVPAEKLESRADGLFIVADGMGGHAGGEIASRITVETVPVVVSEKLTQLNGQASSASLETAIREAIGAANEAVWKQARANPELRGMGTTCVVVLAKAGMAAIGNVGDSRVYLLRGGRLSQITADHSLVQEHVRAGEMTADEARESRFKNVITRGIGLASQVEPDVELLEMEEGDTLLLCSDGLSGMVRDHEIARILSESADAQVACDRLVEAANRSGGQDNISTVVVRYGVFVPVTAPSEEPDDEPIPFATAPARQPAMSPAVLALIALTAILGALLINVGRESYEVTSGAPFIRHRTPKQPPALSAPAPPDLVGVTYGRPLIFSAKPVKRAPLVSDSAGNLYAVTLNTGKVVRFGADGTMSTDYPAKLPADSGDAALYWASDSQGNLYMSFQADRAIRKFTPTGTRVAELGRDSLVSPGAVAVDGKGSVYVIDENRIKIFRSSLAAPDSQTGRQADRRTGRQDDGNPPGINSRSVIRGPQSEARDGAR